MIKGQKRKFKPGNHAEQISIALAVWIDPGTFQKVSRYSGGTFSLSA